MSHTLGSKLSTKEWNELEKYVKFLVFKMSQIIVQSRFGERKLFTDRKVPARNWFNLAVEDNAEIQAKAKEAYSTVQPLKNFCICTEILLKTVDGDILVLETWSLSMDTSDCFLDSPYVSYTSLASVYCRMTLLLKSIMSVTRITPASKLSTRQSADTYVILYRIYSGEPQIHELGEYYMKSKIGQVLTPVGTLKVSIFYRSKDNMTVRPQKIEKGKSFMLKSDYFKTDKCPDLLNSDEFQKNDFSCQNMPSDFRKTGAFALPSSLQDRLFPELDVLEKPFLNLSRSKLHHHTNKLKIDDQHKNADRNANMKNVDNKENEVDYNCNSNDMAYPRPACNKLFESDDFLMMEMKPPFADCDGENDIGAFFRECQTAPPLASFSLQPTLEQQVNDITTQLVKFETSMNDFDHFVDSICQSDFLK